MPSNLKSEKPKLRDFLTYLIPFVGYGLFAVVFIALISYLTEVAPEELFKFSPLLVIVIVLQTVNFVFINRKTRLVISETNLNVDAIVAIANKLGYNKKTELNNDIILSQTGFLANLFGGQKRTITVTENNGEITITSINYLVKAIRSKLRETYDID